MASKRASRYRNRHLLVRRAAPPGTPPGTIELPALTSLGEDRSTTSGVAPTLRVLRFDRSRYEETRATTADLRHPDFLPHDLVTWLDIEGPLTSDVAAELRDALGLHPLALEDAQGSHQRAKVEEYDAHLFVVLRAIGDSTGSTTHQLALFLGPHVVVTIHAEPEPAIETIVERLRQAAGRVRTLGADYLAYAIIDAAIDRFFPALERIGEALERLEEEVVSRPDNGLLPRLHDLRHDLLALRRVVWPTRDLLASLLHERAGFINAATLPFLRDCHDHTHQAIDLLEAYREVTSNLLELTLSLQNHQVNESMRLMAVIATIFMPLSWIAGIYGMNFDHEASPYNMPELFWRYGYPFAILLMAVVALALLSTFWKMGWLGGRRN